MGIKRERCTAIVLNEDKLLCVRLEDPKSKTIYTVPPGGLIEENENAVDATVRETLEETGYKIKVDPNSELVGKYPFHWNGENFDCTTHFFKAALVDKNPSQVADATYHRGVVWVPLNQVRTHLSFHPELSRLICLLIEII